MSLSILNINFERGSQLATLGTAVLIASSISATAAPLSHLVTTVALGVLLDMTIREGLGRGVDRFFKPKLYDYLYDLGNGWEWGINKFWLIQAPMTPILTFRALKVASYVCKNIIPLTISSKWTFGLVVVALGFFYDWQLFRDRIDQIVNKLPKEFIGGNDIYPYTEVQKTCDSLSTDRSETAYRLAVLSQLAGKEFQLIEQIRNKAIDLIPRGVCEIGEVTTTFCVETVNGENPYPAMKRRMPLVITDGKKPILESAINIFYALNTENVHRAYGIMLDPFRVV
jgi:hypothetical protein